MKIYGKILLATLPLVLMGFLVASGITYYLSCAALRALAHAFRARLWLESEVQRHEIEVRLYPRLRHSGQGWEGLKVTHSGHR